MSEGKDNRQNVFALVTILFVITAIVSFVVGAISNEGMNKRHADDFGMIRLQDTLYRVEVLRRPYTPETVTIQELKEKARQEREEKGAE